MADSSHNSLIVRDFRQAISILSVSVPASFTSIQFFSDNDASGFRIPFDSPSSPNLRSTKWSFDIEVDPHGRLRFEYDVTSSIAISLSLWVGFLAFAWPIFRSFRNGLLTRHQELVKLSEAHALAELAAQVSHDLRSPVGAIAAAVKARSQTSNQSQLIEAAANRINDIADDLLQRYRRSSLNHQQQEAMKEYDLRSLLEEMHHEKLAIPQATTKLYLDLGPRDEPCHCRVDRKEFLRAVSNLLNNALDSLADADSADGQITLALRANSEVVQVIISDNGPGIADETLARLGLEPVSYGKPNGTGLGVWHAKRFCEQHGGHLQIQSRWGHGTIVTIALPRSWPISS